MKRRATVFAAMVLLFSACTKEEAKQKTLHAAAKVAQKVQDAFEVSAPMGKPEGPRTLFPRSEIRQGPPGARSFSHTGHEYFAMPSTMPPWRASLPRLDVHTTPQPSASRHTSTETSSTLSAIGGSGLDAFTHTASSS